MATFAKFQLQLWQLPNMWCLTKCVLWQTSECVLCCFAMFFGLQSQEIPKQFGMVVIEGLSWCILITLAASVLTCQDGWCQL